MPKVSAPLSKRIARLCRVRRAISFCRKLDRNLTALVVDSLQAQGLDSCETSKADVTLYQEGGHNIDAETLFKSLGQDAWQYLRVDVGKIRRAQGDELDRKSVV